MNKFEFYLNEASNFNIEETLKGFMQSLGLPEYPDKIPNATKGYVKKGKKSLQFTLYSEDRVSTKEQFEGVLKSNNMTFKNENRAISSVPVTIVDGYVIIYKPLLGSGGSGSGAKATEIQEIAQAVFISLAFNVLNKKLKESDITEENLNKGYEYVNENDVPIGDIVAMTNDPKWESTFIKTTNLIFKDYYDASKTYTLERGSELVDAIYREYNTLKKEVGISASNDKWNPADIWLISNKVSKVEKTNTLIDLNSFLKKKYVSKDLIGISLKKLGSSPKIGVYNLSKSEGSKRYKEYIVSPKSKDMYLVTKDGDRIQFRSANNLSNYRAEIKGKTANHGNAGYGILRYSIQKYGQFLLPKNSVDIANKIRKNDVKTMSRFAELYKKYTDIEVDYTKMKEYAKEMGSKKPEDWIFSKYISLEILDSFESLTPKHKDEYINDIYNYASSNSDFSSIFVKIS